MFTEYSFENYRVFQKNFSSLSELNLFLLSNPPVNTAVFGSPKKINSVYFPDSGMPYDDCVRYLLGGYHEDIPELLRLEDSISSTIDTTSERIYKKSPIGSRPNVVNYIAGSPLTMYKKQKYEDIKLITIYFNIQTSFNTTKMQYLHRGIITYELIRLLEANGFKVNLSVFCAASREDEMAYYQIGIKNPEERFILSESNTFALCAPEMFRRILFRVMESTPFKNPRWGKSYGVKVQEDVLKRFLNLDSSSILISNPKEMGIKGEKLSDDAFSCLDRLNLSNSINVDDDLIRFTLSQKNM